MPADSWKLAPGLSNVGSYQVSGKPYATGSINCKLDTRDLTDCEVTFPYVTRWFKVVNKDGTEPCRVSFSLNGMTGSSNYFTVGASATSGELELKVSSIWLSGSTNVDIVAGLTWIPESRTGTDDGPSWSGSLGVG